MSGRYDPAAVEAKWRAKWEAADLYKIDLKKAKDSYYALVMFPYPSGARLHVGHWYQYGPTDSFARFMKMKGKDVFFPMGFDAFGLPAENYAIKTGVPPAESTAQNVANMIEQFKRMGTMYDWSKTLNTSTPEYYRWTQWLFLEMYKHKLAYKKLANVNWCPLDQTVLANEQAQDGVCERCGTPVVQKPLNQWFWKITDYADRLLDGHKDLDWPEKTKTMQRNWIGKSEGAEIRFEIDGSHRGIIGPINWPITDAGLVGDLNRRLTDEWKRRIHSPRTVHLVFTPYKRTPLFEERKFAERLLRILAEVAERHDIVLHETCVMPDHVHLLVSFEGKRHLEKDIVKKLKCASAREFLLSLNDDTRRLWGEGIHFEDVITPEQFMSTMRYIQGNPEKADIQAYKRLLSQIFFDVTVFTTRPDMLFGATYLVLAPEHALVEKITPENHWGAVHAYREEIKKKTEMERTDLNKTKSGVPTGAFALHPVTGEKLPIWIADYVLANYGTGAIMAVPGHDQRDWEFARQYELPIKEVVQGGNIQESAFGDDGVVINSDFLDGLATKEAKKKMVAWLADHEKGRLRIQYRLRDWLVSRQRYWGAPIPIVYDPEGNAHAVPEEHLPWLLPTDVEFSPTGESPLKLSKELKERTEKLFGKGWTPEYDTMDTFVCSSFYFLRFLATDEVENEKLKIERSSSKKTNTKQLAASSSLVDPQIEKQWMPVDCYIGGPEHACMHLIYARFVTMALKDFGHVKTEDPFKKLIHQGLITNQGAKMSKSKGNVVDPDPLVQRYGADVFRMYLMFMGPYTQGGDWSDTGIKGVDRFAQRLHRLFTEHPNKKVDHDSDQIQAVLHKTIKKVGEDIEAFQFNTAISSLMELLNAFEAAPGITIESLKIVSILLAPLAPHLAEELFEMIGGKGFIFRQQWPNFDPQKLIEDSVTIAVQVNGKLRTQLTVPTDIAEADVIALAKAEEKVMKYLEGKEPKKAIYVKGRLVSLVV